MPTRFPFGISFLKPHTASAGSANWTFTAGDTTPDVSLGTFFIANISGLTITNFDLASEPPGAEENGKIIFVLSTTAGATVIQDSAGGIRTSRLVIAPFASGSGVTVTTGGDLTLQENELVSFMKQGNTWYQLNKSVQL